MVTNMLKKLLHLDLNEAKVAEIKASTKVQVDQATSVLRKQGKLQKILIHKTTTFYLAQALGLLE